MAMSMAQKKAKWMKTAKWIYWIVTLLFVSTMIMGGVSFLMGTPTSIEGVTQLGYPAYLCKILGVAKLLGAIAILYGRNRTLKEWAYAGYSFNILGASASFLLHGDPFIKIIGPLIILFLVLVSYRQWKTGWM